MSNSHNHGKRNSKQQIPQRKLGTALRDFFEHVTSHDEKGVHAALCMVANAVPQDPNAPTEINGVPVVGMHICNFGAGDPDALAQMMIMAIDTMVEDLRLAGRVMGETSTTGWPSVLTARSTAWLICCMRRWAEPGAKAR